MSIDWFTFTAQIINFLVLVWLLSHFLYKPIVNAMNDRQARIAAEHEQALSAKRDADSAAAAPRPSEQAETAAPWPAGSWVT